MSAPASREFFQSTFFSVFEKTTFCVSSAYFENLRSLSELAGFFPAAGH